MDVACLQETWLNAGDSSIYQIIKEHNYKILKWERSQEKLGGGLVTIYKPYISLKNLKDKFQKKKK